MLEEKNRAFVKPYIGGEDVNSSPTLTTFRYVIDFGSMTLEQARQYPALLGIVEAKVKPHRDTVKRDVYRTQWWRFGERQNALYEGIRGMSRVLVCCQVSPNLCFAFLPTDFVYSYSLNIFLIHEASGFAQLQSRVHEVWARAFGSTMKDDLRYTPSDCFETFPFPIGCETDIALERAGREYYEFRAALMVRNNEGLTKTYNRFHGPDERDADILKLRDLHAAMDRAVLDAYGWTDIQPTCEFILDYEDEEDEEPGKASRRKKPWRYRWPDEIRDDVLARLLELNAERAGGKAGAESSEQNKGVATKKRRKKSGPAAPLFADSGAERE
jgi:hypothetical protein